MVFEKVKWDNVKIQFKKDGDGVVFSVDLEDEKLLNLAAGKIARGVASKVGVWELKGKVLTLKVSVVDCGFGEVVGWFGGMVADS